MAYSVVYKDSVKRDLKKIGKAEARRLLDRIENELCADPESCPALKGEFAGLRKFRIGNYRVVFTIMPGQILVLRVAHRKDAYR